LEPEILVVDEVLAVGDAEFQKKCLGKMGEVTKNGRTVLFVSHLLPMITRLCRSVVVLNGGKLVYQGDPSPGIQAYQGTAGGGTPAVSFSSAAVPNSQARIVEVALLDCNGKRTNKFYVHDRVNIRIGIQLFETLDDLRIGFIIGASTGENIYHCDSNDTNFRVCSHKGRLFVEASFSKISLYPGDYVLRELTIATGLGEVLDRKHELLTFLIEGGGPHVLRRLSGMQGKVHVLPEWMAEGCETRGQY
jgi:lipopolysaccharide transport system ATP-binding protein